MYIYVNIHAEFYIVCLLCFGFWQRLLGHRIFPKKRTFNLKCISVSRRYSARLGSTSVLYSNPRHTQTERNVWRELYMGLEGKGAVLCNECNILKIRMLSTLSKYIS